MSNSEINLAPRVTKYAEKVLDRVDILSNRYFTTMQNGQMSLAQFRKSQEQFYFAVAFFSRPMASLIARIPNAKDRLDIIHNLLEEHGHMEEGQFHITSFKNFLASIGSDTSKLDTIKISPQIRAFNCVLTTSCTFDDLSVGLSCLGVIERAFASISALIAKTVLANGWLKQDELYHYNLHADLDIKHSEEFFILVERFWRNNKKRQAIKQGLELGAYIFDRLYTDLCKV